jgi:hypothetical protein
MDANYSSNLQPCEITKPDYQAAFAAIARRVAAADAYFVSGNNDEARREIEQAMLVIERAENPFVFIPSTF